MKFHYGPSARMNTPACALAAVLLASPVAAWAQTPPTAPPVDPSVEPATSPGTPGTTPPAAEPGPTEPEPRASEPATSPPPPGDFVRSTPALNPGLPSTDPNGDPVAAPVTEDHIEAKFGNGVTFQAGDGDLRLQLRGRIQPRFTTLVPADGDPINEMIIRRARLAFNGRFLDAWELYLQLGFSVQDNESDNYNPLRDATITYAGLRDLVVRAGQMKVPFDRQRMTSSSALEFPDRSLVVGELTLDRDVGIQVFSEDLFGLDGVLAYNLGLFSGDGRNQRAENAGLMWVGRLTVSPFGAFDAHVEGDFERKGFRMALGMAAAQNYQSVRSRSTFADTYESSTFDYTHLTADLTIKYRGLFWLTQFLYREADRPSNTFTVDGEEITEYSRSGYGFFTQAGYLWNEHFETAARYGELRSLPPTDPALSAGVREIGGAVSWYFLRHDLKVTADYFCLLPLDAADATHQIRVQSQLYF